MPHIELSINAVPAAIKPIMWIEPAVAIGQSWWSSGMTPVYSNQEVVSSIPTPARLWYFFTAAQTCTEHSVFIYVGI